MPPHSRSSSFADKLIQIHNYYDQQVNHADQHADEEGLYYDKIEKHLLFMEKEFKYSMVWQRQLMKQIKYTRNVQQALSNCKQTKAIHINKQQESFLKKLLKKHCQINNDDLSITELIKLATKARVIKENQRKNILCIPTQSNSRQHRQNSRFMKEANLNGLLGDSVEKRQQRQIFIKNKPYTSRQERFEDSYGDRNETSHFKEFNQSPRDSNCSIQQNASLNYSLSGARDGAQDMLLRHKQVNQKPIYLISKEERARKIHQKKQQQEYAAFNAERKRTISNGKDGSKEYKSNHLNQYNIERQIKKPYDTYTRNYLSEYQKEPYPFTNFGRRGEENEEY